MVSGAQSGLDGAKQAEDLSANPAVRVLCVGGVPLQWFVSPKTR
jgi:hypothetical protein